MNTLSRDRYWEVTNHSCHMVHSSLLANKLRPTYKPSCTPCVSPAFWRNPSHNIFIVLVNITMGSEAWESEVSYLAIWAYITVPNNMYILWTSPSFQKLILQTSLILQKIDFIKPELPAYNFFLLHTDHWSILSSPCHFPWAIWGTQV